MGKAATRDWGQIYAIYGMDEWQTLMFLLLHAIFFSILSVLFLVYFDTVCCFFEWILLSSGGARFAAGFTGCVTALSSICLFFAAGNIFYSSVSLHWDMAQRMVNLVNDWSSVKLALDVGCGRGMLLNTVALQVLSPVTFSYIHVCIDTCFVATFRFKIGIWRSLKLLLTF